MQTSDVGYLSKRITSIEESATFRMFAEANRLKSEGVDIADFSAGEPDFNTPENIKRAGILAIERGQEQQLPDAGLAELREAVCFRHRMDFGTDYSMDECCISSGGKQALFNVTQSILNPGDEAILPVPYWVTFRDLIKYTGAECRLLSTNEGGGWSITASAIEKVLTSRTRLLLLCSPSNPSGSVIPRGELKRIIDLALDNDIFVLADECYSRFVYDSPLNSVASDRRARDLVIVVGSVSKTYAMTGWRVGYTLGPRCVVDAVTLLQNTTTTSPTFFSQYAAVEALTGPQDSVDNMLAEFRKRRDYIVTRLGAISGVSLHIPEGAFYVYPNIGPLLPEGGHGASTRFAEDLLFKSQVAVVPGDGFGTDSHIRISYATSMETISKGMDRFARFCSR